MIIMLYLFISVLMLLFDQLTKYFTIARLNEYESFVVTEKFLSFTRCHNTGGPWSLFDEVPFIFVVATLCIFAIEIWFIKKHPLKHSLAKFSCALINAGAIGNLLDRIFRGYVVDMIELTFIDYPIFNFADCCVVVGAILMCVYVIFIEGKDKNSRGGK